MWHCLPPEFLSKRCPHAGSFPMQFLIKQKLSLKDKEATTAEESWARGKLLQERREGLRTGWRVVARTIQVCYTQRWASQPPSQHRVAPRWLILGLPAYLYFNSLMGHEWVHVLRKTGHWGGNPETLPDPKTMKQRTNTTTKICPPRKRGSTKAPFSLGTQWLAFPWHPILLMRTSRLPTPASRFLASSGSPKVHSGVHQSEINDPL